MKIRKNCPEKHRNGLQVDDLWDQGRRLSRNDLMKWV